MADFPDYTLDFPMGLDGSNSRLEDEYCELLNQPNPLFGSIMVALVVIGLIGNSLVFFTILVLHEYKKSVTNWYILQLTLADTLFLLMLPFTAHSEVVGKWEFSLSLCKFKEAVIFINYYASIYFLVIMSFDRYLAVTKAFDSRKWLSSLRSGTASYVISAVGWILSTLLCVQLYRYSKITKCNQCEYIFPQVIKKEVVNNTDYHTYDIEVDPKNILRAFINLYSPNDYESPILNIIKNQSNAANSSFSPILNTQCLLQPSRELNVWIYGNFIGAFVLPFLLICYFYGMIMRTVSSASLVESNLKQKSYRRRVTMIVLALVSLFAITWLPWYIEKIVKISIVLPLSYKACSQLTNAVRGIAYMNSALNPYFYSFLGFHFRDRLKKAGSRVRFVMSFRQSYRTSSVRRRQHYNSSSISAGYRMNPNAMPIGKPNLKEKETVGRGRAGTCQKTEKTDM